FAKGINTFPFIHVKQPEVLQRFACLLTDIGQQISGRYALVDQDGDIPPDFRETGKFAELRQPAFGDLFQAPLEYENRPLEIQLIDQLRMQRAQPADQFAVSRDTSALARVQRRMFRRLEDKGSQCTALPQHRFDITLHIMEVELVAAVCPALRQARTTGDT